MARPSTSSADALRQRPDPHGLGGVGLAVLGDASRGERGIRGFGLLVGLVQHRLPRYPLVLPGEQDAHHPRIGQLGIGQGQGLAARPRPGRARSRPRKRSSRRALPGSGRRAVEKGRDATGLSDAGQGLAPPGPAGDKHVATVGQEDGQPHALLLHGRQDCRGRGGCRRAWPASAPACCGSRVRSRRPASRRRPPARCRQWRRGCSARTWSLAIVFRLNWALGTWANSTSAM